MTRERLSEEERLTADNLEALNEFSGILGNVKIVHLYSIVQHIVTARVTAARLAATEAAFEATAQLVEQRRRKVLSDPTELSYTEHFAELQRDIRALSAFVVAAPSGTAVAEQAPHPLSFAGFLESWERVFRFLESCGIHNYEELQERLRQIQAEVKRG